MGEEFHSILAVIGPDEAESEAVLERAAAVAGRSHGLLTIAALAYPGRLAVWLASIAATAPSVPAFALDATGAAQDRLARAAEFVPVAVGIRTLVIPGAPRGPMRRLLSSGSYDLVVVGAHLASRRRLAPLAIPALVVPAGAMPAQAGDRAGHPAVTR
jgi:nucleotide-binding universal stress UspA family protein